MKHIDCSRINYDLLRVTIHRKALLASCSEKYRLINFFLLFEEHENLNWLFVLIALMIVPIAFFNLKLVADNYLSKSIMRVKSEFRISALTAAASIIPLANGAPDLLISFVSTSQADGADIAVSSILGAFIFAWTIVTSYIIFRSPREVIPLPVKPFLKEVCFSYIGLLLITILGIFHSKNRFFAALPFSFFIIYLSTSLYLAQTDPSSNSYAIMEEEDTPIIPPNEHFPLKRKLQLHIFNENSLFLNIIFSPFKLIYLLTVPYHENPLMKTNMKYFIIFAAFSCFLVFFELMNSLVFTVFIALILSTTFLLLISFANPRNLILLLGILTLIASIGWMKVLSSILLDAITFVAFTIGKGERLIMMLVLSVGNSVSDLFSNGAISASGGDVMAFFGAFASQLFNMFLGISLNIFFGAEKTGFDIFGFQKKSSSLDSQLIKIQLSFGAIVLSVVTIYYMSRKKFQKNYVPLGTSLYFLFLLVCVLYTILAS